ncbi:t-complex polypeptide 1 [Heterostelium album PN500]|uniref:T-complex protein 1 subunit alpha n=1 Tax=Heterostelium pallidum (strain ATCC 26659 / Pp 5 / PN500) TaxID=670386 RepID=D3BCV5_HETP5|nr:t-complex polypeptide 1 [Heterostelium album PN500]EFA80747.1 t-complex polypeptide 1 [Heterostelium album PN500]|eukprot:XP_020432867.1 t-complex polypeptide 1 [Heterostelium album PN500]
MSLKMLNIDGERISGQDVRTQNVTAVTAIANIVKTSFGPIGLDKMLVDNIGDITITNDGATILKLLEVEHPAAKVLVQLADLQDQEVGDGTTSVVILAAELLKRANELVLKKIHPTIIISGYRIACQDAIKYINETLAVSVDSLPKDFIINTVKTSMSSKIIGDDSDFFSKIVVDALARIKTIDYKGDVKYPINSINVLKAHGKSAKESSLVEGYALNCTVASEGMPKRVVGAKIAFLDFNLQKAKMKLGQKVIVTNVNDLEAIRDLENNIIRDRIQLILKSGANVVLTTKGIDDLCLKYFVEAGVMAVRRCRKEDLKRIAKACGGTVLITMNNLEGDESFDTSSLGAADEVVQERIADDELLLVKNSSGKKAASIILRGANSMMLDEMERSIHDSLCIAKRTLESGTVVPGGGCVESALSIYLDNFAETMGSRKQLVISEFAESLLVIPKQLSVNAAQDATDLVAKLRSYHHVAQTDATKKNYAYSGLDLINGKVRNNLEAGVLEPAIAKVKCIKFATEAAITILRIDDMIKLNPKEAAQDPHGHGDY